MKNYIKFLGIIIMAVIIALAFTACPIEPEEPIPDESTPGTPSGQTPGGQTHGGGQTPGGGQIPGGGQTPGGSHTDQLVEMVPVTSGTFTMGSPSSETNKNNETQHTVTLTGFYIGKYEVTQEQYQTVMGTNPSRFISNPTSGETQNKRPVEQVSWYDALVFCNKLSIREGLSPAYNIKGSTDPAAWGTVPTSVNIPDIAWNAVTIVSGSTGYRLPTEAQWEYACRAGTTTAYNTGASMNDNTGWYANNSGGKTHEVGKKPANAWGLYDMHGNVYEWCWDWYGDYSIGAQQTDPLGASSGSVRVCRSGSYAYAAENARSASRSSNSPESRSDGLGFRLMRP